MDTPASGAWSPWRATSSRSSVSAAAGEDGLQVVLDRRLPLTGELPPAAASRRRSPRPGSCRSARPSRARVVLHAGRPEPRRRPRGARAGRARRRPRPPAARRAPARRQCSLYGARLPAGGVPLDEDTPVPVVSIPSSARREAARGDRARRRRGASRSAPAHDGDERGVADRRGVLVDRPRVRRAREARRRRAGREHRDDRAGRRAARSATRYGTVNGTSAAAAAVAGAAAVLAQARPRARRRPICAACSSRARARLAVGARSRARARGSSRSAPPPRPRSPSSRRRSRSATRRGAAGSARRPSSSATSRRARSFVRMRSAPYAQGAAPVEFHAVPVALPARRPERRSACASSRRCRRAPIGAAPAEGSIVVAPVAGAPLHLPVGRDVRAAAGSVLGPLQALDDIVRAVRRRARAADVPRGTARAAGGPRRGAAGRAAHAPAARLGRKRPRHARHAARPAARAATRSASPAERLRATRSQPGRYRTARDRGAEPRRAARAVAEVAFTIK